jgi:hypothetical protein
MQPQWASKGIGAVAVGIVLAVAILLVVLSWRARNVSGQGSCPPNDINQATAEALAIHRARFYDFNDGGDDPTVVSAEHDLARNIGPKYDTDFGYGATFCVWYVTLEGGVERQRVISRPGAYSGVFTRMEVGLKASDGALMSETFHTADYTPEATATGSTPTAVATPTAAAAPTATATPP